MDIVDSSTGVSSSGRPNWVMLDSYVRLNYDTTPQMDHPEDRDATFAEAKTSIAKTVGVWFRAVPPPGTSRLYVSWPQRRHDTCGSPLAAARRPPVNRSHLAEPRVVDAHGNSILLQCTLNAGYYAPLADFFVYTVHSGGAPPSLRRLPTCPHRMESEHLGPRGLVHMLRIANIGLLSRGDGEYLVADLRVLPTNGDADTPLEAQMCVFRSHAPNEWKLSRPHIRHEHGQGEDLFWWSMDAVVPCGDALCYVGYLRGILVGSVRGGGECSELHYIRLPVKVSIGDPVDPELGTRFRSVCATKGGILKFVDVACTTIFVAGSRSPVSSTFTIKLWRLRDDHNGWEQENELGDEELWSLQGYAHLPHVVPEFPLVSMEDPYVIYFMLKNDSDRHSSGDDSAWIVAVDMLNKTVRSSSTYTIVETVSSYDGDMASRNLAAYAAFIPCEFSRYLKVVSGTT